MTRRAILGGISVGDGLPVAVMGVLNVSPESFYRGSVYPDPDELLGAAEGMVEAGAEVLDLGAMSTAPYLPTRVTEAEEAERLGQAVERLVGKLGVPISADTSRAAPAKAALEAGATIVNDVSGLTADPAMAGLVALTGAGLIVMASPRGGGPKLPGPVEPAAHSPVSVVTGLLAESLDLARSAGIAEEKIIVDPGIGFFRQSGRPWFEWDCEILARLGELEGLGRPVCVGVSRKSFIGALLGQADPGERLAGSLAATAVAVVKGAHLIRTHDVAETRQAVRVAQAIRQFDA
jgi:dihydropteroate synthase